jgi:glucosamine--fructose-6-phosphate aminotransferase (isomerizing)
MGITNVVGSAVSRATDCGIYLMCGPEIGVASTKAYTSQIIAITLMALKLGEDKVSSQSRRVEIIQGLKDLPNLIRYEKYHCLLTSFKPSSE